MGEGRHHEQDADKDPGASCQATAPGSGSGLASGAGNRPVPEAPVLTDVGVVLRVRLHTSPGMATPRAHPAVHPDEDEEGAEHDDHCSEHPAILTAPQGKRSEPAVGRAGGGVVDIAYHRSNMTDRQIPAGGPGTGPDTVVAALRQAARDHADAEAYVEVATPGVPGVVPPGPDRRRRLRFAEWDTAADGVAAVLAERGVSKGDVVCLLLPSSIDYAVCYQAAARLGAVTSGLNLRLGDGERRSILARCGPAVTVVDADEVDLARLPPEVGLVVERHELAGAASRTAPSLPALSADQPVCIVWTSGSTGAPKGALFDHRNLAAVAEGTDVLSRPGDRRLSPLPFAHVGYMTRVWDEIVHGIATVITPQPWSAAEAIALMAEEAVTVGQGVPTQWALVLRHPDLDGADLSALRVAGTGAARVPAELVRAMRQRLGCPVVVRYTSTETSLGTSTQPSDSDEVVCTTVGRPVPGVELSVVDEATQPVSGQVGRVRLRSGAAMRGFVGTGAQLDRDATDSVIDAAGWVTTGDLGWIDDAGNLHLVGREAEMYIRGGYNVYPAEVEAVLRRHPGVQDVAVVGLDDPILGEIGAAFVVVNPTTSESAPTLADLRNRCCHELSDYKAPDRLFLLDGLPVTAMGKIDTRALKAMGAGRSPVHTSRGVS